MMILQLNFEVITVMGPFRFTQPVLHRLLAQSNKTFNFNRRTFRQIKTFHLEEIAQ